MSTPAMHWRMRWAPFRRRRRRTSALRTPTRHGCLTTPSTPWRCRHGQMISGRLWRGGCSALWSWMDIPNVGDIKEKYVPYIRTLREAQNPWNQEAGLSKSSWRSRSTGVATWSMTGVEPVPQEAAGALYDRLGYSQDLIMQLGSPWCLWFRGPGGQGIGPQGQDSGGSGHHAPHAGPGHQKVPPDHHVHCHGGRGQEVHQQALPDGNQARVLGLGGVRPCPAQHQRMGSGGQGEVQDHRGLHVQGWKASCGGTRLLQITGWHKDKATCLELVMDEPPEQLYNQWIRDRTEFYKRVEPTERPPGTSG